MARDARYQLNARLSQNQGTRELIYLDLALEQLLRTLVERSLGPRFGGEQLVDLTPSYSTIWSLPKQIRKLGICANEWKSLRQTPRFGREWSLHAKAVLDRVEHFLGGFIDRPSSSGAAQGRLCRECLPRRRGPSRSSAKKPYPVP